MTHDPSRPVFIVSGLRDADRGGKQFSWWPRLLSDTANWDMDVDRVTDGDTIVRAKLDKWITQIRPDRESQHEVRPSSAGKSPVTLL